MKYVLKHMPEHICSEFNLTLSPSVNMSHSENLIRLWTLFTIHRYVFTPL